MINIKDKEVSTKGWKLPNETLKVFRDFIQENSPPNELKLNHLKGKGIWHSLLKNNKLLYKLRIMKKIKCHYHFLLILGYFREYI